MSSKEEANIKLIVDDEQSLYLKFSPENEFDDSVKSYIRSKIADKNAKKSINLTVISKNPLDERRFRDAVSHWIRDEKVIFRITEKLMIRRLIGLLIFGSIMLLLCLSLERSINVLQYSLMPIMGSLALSRAASILVLDVPEFRAQKWLFSEIEKHNVISFEYDHEDK